MNVHSPCSPVKNVYQLVQEQKPERQKKMVAAQHERHGREAILDAARTLFTRRGFHQTSVAELASAAQVSIGQIYRMFKGKDEIIGAIVHADFDGRLAQMAALKSKLDEGHLSAHKLFEALVSLALEEREEALAFEIMAEGLRNSSVRGVIGDMCARYRAYIRDFACAANPNLSGEALDGAEEVILACLFGLSHRTLSQPRLNAERTAARTARMIMAGLAPTVQPQPSTAGRAA